MARRRRAHEEEHANHERWLVSYADFITLLFAFFVVMYSISQVNESKYRVLSNTLTDVFAKQPEADLNPIQIGNAARSNPDAIIELQTTAASAPSPQQNEASPETEPDTSATQPAESLESISEKIQSALGDLIEKKLVTLKGNEDWLEITLQDSMLFASGESAVTEGAYGLLAQIAAILREQDNPVRVEGFTDNVPIRTLRFASNWELSSARAAAVVQVLIGKGLSPGKLMAAGYGEFQPVAANDTADGRARNRRVVLMVARGGDLRPNLQPVRLAPDGSRIPLDAPEPDRR
jgi:chemotaxis protein MotB